MSIQLTNDKSLSIAIFYRFGKMSPSTIFFTSQQMISYLIAIKDRRNKIDMNIVGCYPPAFRKGCNRNFPQIIRMAKLINIFQIRRSIIEPVASLDLHRIIVFTARSYIDNVDFSSFPSGIVQRGGRVKPLRKDRGFREISR